MSQSNKNIRQKLEELSEEDLPFEKSFLWEKIEERLDKKQTKFIIAWRRISVAACLMLALFLSIYEWNNRSKKNLSENTKARQTSKQQVFSQENQAKKSVSLNEKEMNFDSKNTEKTLRIQQPLTQTDDLKNETVASNDKENSKQIVEPIAEERKELNLKSITGKTLTSTASTIVLMAPNLPKNTVPIEEEKKQRKFGFRIRIFPGLTAPDTNYSQLYVSKESPYQVKIKF